MDRKLGIARPSGPPFTLNSAVDALLKIEFDWYRKQGKPHPLMERYGIKAAPARHPDLDTWRENFKGVQYHHEPTNFIITGAIDDLWINKAGEYIVVDYKATSKAEQITELNSEWHEAYKRQMEIYQWLLRRQGMKVSNTGYILYCNGQKDRERFDAKLEFEMTLIAHKGDDSWVEDLIMDAHRILNQKRSPKAKADCEYCQYISMVAAI